MDNGTLSSQNVSADKAHYYASIASFIAALLALIKLGLYFISGSMIVAFSAWENLGDSIISLVNRYVILYARKGDEHHPYGRGKAENLASLVQGAVISAGAIIIIVSSSQKLYKNFTDHVPPPTTTWPIGLFFIATAVLSFFIAIILKKGSKKYNSPALNADSEHYKVDVISNSGAGVAIFIMIVTKWFWLDALIALVFSCQIIWNGLRLIKESFEELMDRDIPDSLKKEVVEIVLSRCDKVIDIHNFRGRKSGSRVLLDFHLTLPSTLRFEEVHAIAEDIENTLKAKLNGDCIIHPDPDTVPIAGTEILYSKVRS